MRTYGSIQTKFWTHRDVIGLSDQSKLLASYLLSSPHTNMLGCFRIPIGYIAEDLRWTIETATKALNDLSEIDFLTYDPTSGWVIIHNFLKYHPIENPNQGRSIAKLFDEIPQNLGFILDLVHKLSQQTKHLDDEFIDCLQTLSKPFRNQEQNQEQKQEQEDMSGEPDVLSSKDFPFEEIKSKNTSLNSQALEVLTFLNGKTGKAFRDSDANLKLIIARLKSGATVEDCRMVIARKNRDWKGNVKMQEYLRPATLFNAEKFEQYMGELVLPSEEIPDAHT